MQGLPSSSDVLIACRLSTICRDIKMTWVEEISAQSLKDALPLYKAFCWVSPSCTSL